MKRISKDDLRGLYRPADPSVYDGVRNALSHLPEGEERPIVKKKISASLLLAAALVVLSMTALAVSRLNLFREISERTNPLLPLHGADDMIVTDLGRTENDHVILTVEEAVYDGQGAMVLVRLTPRDAGHTALYNPYLQDAPDDVYEKRLMPRRADLGYTHASLPDGTDIDLLNEPDYREMLIGGTRVEIPGDIASAREMNSPVFMDGDVMRLTDGEAPEVTGRKDGRVLIGYELRLGVSGGTGDADLDGMLADFLSYASRAESQDDGSVLIWFNGAAETAMTDALRLVVTGTTTLGGRALTLDGLDFTLNLSEAERRFKLVPEGGGLPGIVAIRSAAVNMTRVRGYFNIEYDQLTEDPVSIRPLDGNGNPLNIGQGWAGSDGRRCCEQYEIQAFDAVPEALILEVADRSGNVLGQCVCAVVEAA